MVNIHFNCKQSKGKFNFSSVSVQFGVINRGRKFILNSKLFLFYPKQWPVFPAVNSCFRPFPVHLGAMTISIHFAMFTCHLRNFQPYSEPSAIWNRRTSLSERVSLSGKEDAAPDDARCIVSKWARAWLLAPNRLWWRHGPCQCSQFRLHWCTGAPSSVARWLTTRRS